MSTDGKLILNLTQGRVICGSGVLADSPLQRLRGLLGRRSLSADEGLLIWPAPSIHTAFMRFPIDALFLDRELRVLKRIDGLRPWRMASARRARGVLELAAGQAARHQIELGDRVGVLELEPRQVDAVAHWHGRHLGAHRHDVPRELPEPVARAVVGGGPLRVLVLAGDRHFRAAAAALLTRRGCSVSLAERTRSAGELARCHDADVVVLDASSSLTATAREVAELERLEPAVGVVVVGEEPQDSLAAMPVIAKWGSFDALCSAVDAARPSRPRGGRHGLQ